MQTKIIWILGWMLFAVVGLSAQQPLKLCSWNLKDFGRTKTSAEISLIADVLKGCDVVAIQEVVAKDPGGAQAVALLADELNRKGSKWDYCISLPTSSSAYKAERYAFLWKSARVTKQGDAWLETKYGLEIDREPYFASFEVGGQSFTVVNFHAIRRDLQPETEIKYFKYLPEEYPNLNLLFAGDFNCPQSHSVFNPLKAMGYTPALIGQKTSLRKECAGDECLASEFDNVFYNGSIQAIAAGVVHFYTRLSNLEEANHLSDHLPVMFEFSLR